MGDLLLCKYKLVEALSESYLAKPSKKQCLNGLFFLFSSRNVNLITSPVITSLFSGHLAKKVLLEVNFDKIYNDNFVYLYKLSQVKYFIHDGR